MVSGGWRSGSFVDPSGEIGVGNDVTKKRRDVVFTQGAQRGRSRMRQGAVLGSIIVEGLWGQPTWKLGARLSNHHT